MGRYQKLHMTQRSSEVASQGSCRSKLQDDDSSMNQEVLMMTKSPKEWFQNWVNKFKIKINFKIH